MEKLYSSGRRGKKENRGGVLLVEDKRKLASEEVKKIKQGLNKKRAEVELSFKRRIKIKEDFNETVLNSLKNCHVLKRVNPEDFKYLKFTEE